MTSVVDICNDALREIGDKRISDLNEQRKEARVCKGSYADARDAVLSKHAWSCARKRRSLASVSPGPDWGWSYKYRIPSDEIPGHRIKQTSNGLEDGPVIEAVREGDFILTNQEPPFLYRYIQRLENPAEIDPLIRKAIATDLAARIVTDLGGSTQDKERLEAKAERDFIRARNADQSPGKARQLQKAKHVLIRKA